MINYGLLWFYLEVKEGLPEYYSNFDIHTIKTPVNAEILHNLLVTSGYPRDKTEFLIKGFTEGFDLGYEGPEEFKTIQKTFL